MPEEHLFGYVIPLAVLAASTLFLPRRTPPPNRILGFRTEDTLSDPDDWYRFNRAMGWRLAPAAALSFVFNLTLWWAFPDWPPEKTVSWTKGGTVIPLLVGILLSVRYYLRPPEPGGEPRLRL
ncbi:MAG: SdpI family protein [Acidobacteria bacterium]|nr:SdpI family protein [Acidobacteriota bacterium]